MSKISLARKGTPSVDKEDALQKIKWLKMTMDLLAKVVVDGDDPNCADAHKLVDALESHVSLWMKARYGDGENG